MSTKSGEIIPREDLRALVELGYASENEALREIAGRVDAWMSKLSFYLQTIRINDELIEQRENKMPRSEQ